MNNWREGALFCTFLRHQISCLKKSLSQKILFMKLKSPKIALLFAASPSIILVNTCYDRIPLIWNLNICKMLLIQIKFVSLHSAYKQIFDKLIWIYCLKTWLFEKQNSPNVEILSILKIVSHVCFLKTCSCFNKVQEFYYTHAKNLIQCDSHDE